MANVGTAAAGKTLVGAGNGRSPTYVDIGTNSGLTDHGIIIAQGNDAFVALGAGSAGQIIRSGGSSADPSYSTATYPSTAGANGNVLTSDGTNWTSQAPVGEQIRSFLAIGSATALTTNIAKTVTSVNLTRGTWDITGLVGFSAAAATVSVDVQAGISLTTNVLPSDFGDNRVRFGNLNNGLTNFQNVFLVIPSFRVIAAVTTTYYLVAQSTFSGGTNAGYGRISAVRMG